jgi:hypothetical protein
MLATTFSLMPKARLMSGGKKARYENMLPIENVQVHSTGITFASPSPDSRVCFTYSDMEAANPRVHECGELRGLQVSVKSCL